MSDQNDICPECKGGGRIFKKVRDDARLEAVCPACNGKGTMSAAVSRALVDQDKVNADRKKIDRYPPHPSSMNDYGLDK